MGCADLAAAVQKVKPTLHVFGHIHEAYGRWTRGGTTFINASTCNLAYEPVNSPWIVEWEFWTAVRTGPLASPPRSRHAKAA